MFGWLRRRRFRKLMRQERKRRKQLAETIACIRAGLTCYRGLFIPRPLPKRPAST